MAYLPVSAFQRPLTLAQLKGTERCDPSAHALPEVNKWILFRALVKAREAFGVKDRDLALLQGLLTFYPDASLAFGPGIIIFPSNQTICERMNGMADSTMRRHLRNLLDAGLLRRRDSSNGKRFAIRQNGAQQAFGFDLSPLLEKAGAIIEAAEAADEAKRHCAHQRRQLGLMRRDLFALLPLTDEDTAAKGQAYWETTTRALRRKLSADALEQLCAEHATLIAHLKSLVLNSSDSQNEQHNLNSNIKYFESEKPQPSIATECHKENETLPLDVVLKACPDIEAFHGSEIRDGAELMSAGLKIYRAIGISDQCYKEALHHMGHEQTAIVIAALLQRFAHIRSPGAYLRSLIRKAANGQFSCRPMIMALISTSVR